MNNVNKSFWENYNEFVKNMNEGEARVLMYHGQKGIGKTYFLNSIIQQLESLHKDFRFVYYDFACGTNVLETLVKIKNQLTLKYKSFDFALFEMGWFILNRKRGIIFDKPTLQSFAKENPYFKFLVDTTDAISPLNPATTLLRLFDAASTAIRNRAYTHSQDVQIMESMDAKSLEKYLVNKWSEELEKSLLMQNAPLVIFLDSYDQLVNELKYLNSQCYDLFLRGSDLENGLVASTRNVMWVIAGSKPLRWIDEDPSWEGSVIQYKIEKTSIDDLRSIFDEHKIKDPAVQNELYCKAEGNPKILETLAECVERGVEADLSPLQGYFEKDFTREESYMAFVLAHLDEWSDEYAFDVLPNVLDRFSKNTYSRLKRSGFVDFIKENGNYKFATAIANVLKTHDEPEYVDLKEILESEIQDR